MAATPQFSVSYLLQESLVRNCTAEDYYRLMSPHLEICSPIERRKLKGCHRRIRNREYAKLKRDRHGERICALFEENHRLRRENEELKSVLCMRVCLLCSTNFTSLDQ